MWCVVERGAAPCSHRYGKVAVCDTAVSDERCSDISHTRCYSRPTFIFCYRSALGNLCIGRSSEAVCRRSTKSEPAPPPCFVSAVGFWRPRAAGFSDAIHGVRRLRLSRQGAWLSAQIVTSWLGAYCAELPVSRVLIQESTKDAAGHFSFFICTSSSAVS